MSGLIGPQAYANFQTPYYLTRTDNITNNLVSPVSVLSADLSKSGTIDVDNANGSMSLSSGSNTNTGGPPRLGLNLASGASGIIATVGDGSIVGDPTLQLSANVSGTSTFSRVFDEVFNPVDAITSTPQTQVITPVGFSPNFGNIRPIFYDVSTNKIVVAQTSLIRFFEVTTPEATGTNVVITDPSGNTYSDPEWICCVAGFNNGSGDRTYNVTTIQTVGSPWIVRYDSATTSPNNYVNILAIHRSLLTGG
jgi:hypothetical protein